MKMQSNEFKARLQLIDMTAQQFAVRIGIGERTVYRWLNETTIPLYAVYSLHWFESQYSKGVRL